MSTALTFGEELLSRLMAYLEGSDVVITSAVTNRALALVQLALQQQDIEPFTFLMEQVSQQFTLPELALPPLTPLINRGSISYRK